MIKHIALLFLTFLMLTGCTNSQFYRHPEYKNLVKIEVSDDTVSTLTETPAEDYLIPNSQIFVGGKGYFQKNIGLTGLVGGLTAVTIDRSLNSAATESVESKLQLKFNTELADILNAATLKKAYGLSYEVVQSQNTPEIKLLPSARLDMQADSRASVAFRVTARCKDTISGKEGEKNYFYAVSDIHPVTGAGGWADNDAALLKQAATKALTRLGQAIIQDVSGGFNAKFQSKKVVTMNGIRGTKSILLAEYPEYLIYINMADEPLTSTFFMFDR